MQGNLQDMGVADLIQHNCQDQKTAKVVISNNKQKANIYFKDGAVVHATSGNLEGEEVIYELLKWQQGTFTLQTGQKAPTNSISKSWSGLLLEGARRIDEAANTKAGLTKPLFMEEKPMAKKKSEILAEALDELIQQSSDIDGAAIVGVDGLVYSANVPQRALDEEMVGASSAAVLGLSKRSTTQLKRGGFKQTLIQGDDGNIIVSSLNDDTLFVGLTPPGVNLGMAFAEMRDMNNKLREIL